VHEALTEIGTNTVFVEFVAITVKDTKFLSVTRTEKLTGCEYDFLLRGFLTLIFGSFESTKKTHVLNDFQTFIFH